MTKPTIPRIHNSRPGKNMPLDIGTIHLIGIGGIGMSGIAEILHNLGYSVSGSDLSENANVERLRAMGINVAIGHRSENVKGVAVVVKSSAVEDNNPEIAAARELQIPVIRRAEMLSELARLKATIAIAGTHGKTTTTSLVGRMFEAAGLDPTVINGGIINAYGTNAKLGKGDWLVAEADESDGTFIRVPSTIGVITNIDPEHLTYWGSFDALKAAFRTFVEQMPFYGFAVLCIDHPEVQMLAGDLSDRRIITYGLKNQPDVKAVNIRRTKEGATFDVEVSDRLSEKAKTLKDIFLPLQGQHNVQNVCAAIGIALAIKIPDEIIIGAFRQFSGVKRRFTKTGEVNGVTIIDDYGHHPAEIAATLKAAREWAGDKHRVIAVVQPHRYSRLSELFTEFSTCFGDANSVVVSEVYTAGEKPIEGIHRDALVDRLKKNKVDAHALESEKELAEMVSSLANPGDIVVCLGAGSITYWAHALPKQLEALKPKKAAV